MFKDINIKPVSYLTGVIYTCLIVYVYYSAITYMVFQGWSREDYSHCYLIPMIVLYLIWEKREQLKAHPTSPSFLGIVPFLFGIGLYWIGELGGEYYTMYISLWLVIIGLLWMHLGWEKVKAIGIAFIVMLAMFPFPNFINIRLSLFLQLVSTKIGVSILRFFGNSAFREGNIIDLGFTQLQVVDACSGLRYVMPMMILSLILAYWFKAKFWKKVTLFISSIPLSIFMNSFRIAATGILYGFFGSKVAEGFFHDFSGWTLFMIAIPIFYLEMRMLGGIVSFIPLSIPSTGLSPIAQSKPSTISSKLLFRTRAITFLSIAILLITGWLSHGIEFRERIPIKMSFNEFPIVLEEWSGIRQVMDQRFIDALDLSDYIIINYRDSLGKAVNFYIAYYESQRKGESIHSPETCLPGGGWVFYQSGKVVIPLENHNPAEIRVNRALMQNGDKQQLSYFWFSQRGRILTSLYQLKLSNFWDALTRQRTDGALVRLITSIGSTDSVEEADRRLQRFVKVVVPVLDEFLPM